LYDHIRMQRELPIKNQGAEGERDNSYSRKFYRRHFLSNDVVAKGTKDSGIKCNITYFILS
jgi:hypothetical protein